MLTRLKRKPKPIDTEIEDLFARLNAVSVSSEDYEKVMNQIERLHKMKMQNASRRVSPDTALMAFTNLAGIAVIVRHEQFNVITSKALSFVSKTKV